MSDEDIDRSLGHLLRTRMRFGMFAPVVRDPFASIGPEVIRAPAHVELAREAAEKSIVLLKNNGVLPIRRDATEKSIYLLGHNAASPDVLLGTYYGVIDRLVSILDGMVALIPDHYRVEYRLGMQSDRPNANRSSWTVPGKWDHFDLVIAVVDVETMLEGEGGDAIMSPEWGDRSDIGIPQHQIGILKKTSKTGVPLVVVVAGGSDLASPELHEFADAILYMWYPGEQGGAALAQILYGEVALSGKLHITVPGVTEFTVE